LTLSRLYYRGRPERIPQMSDLSQRGDLASLLSCLAPGRPLHLEGAAAAPLFLPQAKQEGRSPVGSGQSEGRAPDVMLEQPGQREDAGRIGGGSKILSRSRKHFTRNGV
jgi:hypothetical protein